MTRAEYVTSKRKQVEEWLTEQNATDMAEKVKAMTDDEFAEMVDVVEEKVRSKIADVPALVTELLVAVLMWTERHDTLVIGAYEAARFCKEFYDTEVDIIFEGMERPETLDRSDVSFLEFADSLVTYLTKEESNDTGY